MLAKNRKTKQKVAIKLIKFQGEIIKYQTKYIFRELQILKHFSNADDSIFTPQLFDVVITKNDDETGIKDLFLIMEYIPMTIMDVLKAGLTLK